MPSILSDAFQGYPVEPHHPMHVDFKSVKELPESYVWAPQQLEDNPSSGNFHGESVPVIDLHDPSAVKLIGHACKTWGVFQITNHGIPQELLDEIECAARNLFSLPSQQKLAASRSPDGISGYGVARISCFFPKLMWSEGFTIVGSPMEHASRLWPHDPRTFCDTIEEYKKEMKGLAGRLMWLMLGSLGVTEEDIIWGSNNNNNGGLGDCSKVDDICDALQLNHYPACPDPERVMGLAAHTDSTLLTILHQNNASGLQVQREGDCWRTVPPLAGALVVNVGDLLHILSNGLYPSILHRVVVNRTNHRLSVAYLYGPPSRVEISPLKKLISTAHPPLYRPITWTEYLGTKAKHFNRALSSVRLCVPIQGL
ncbi:hypothetical protein SAY87_022620 [Trapa incisa]|uniref:gibberellin 3beta-dioxygenase n=1 Tax=Trapa incisa TaxID=236973 RepID=A0AAN7K4F7_9MYRT|nr:hypothetical protein SAY87_022620 [Trapa incisa]